MSVGRSHGCDRRIQEGHSTSRLLKLSSRVVVVAAAQKQRGFTVLELGELRYRKTASHKLKELYETYTTTNYTKLFRHLCKTGHVKITQHQGMKLKHLQKQEQSEKE